MSLPPESERPRGAASTPGPNSDETFFPNRDVNGAEIPEPGELIQYMDAQDVLRWQIRRAALMAALNIETRSFAEVAESLGVRRQTLSQAYTNLCRRLGWAPMFRKAETRAKNAAAAARRWAQAKTAKGTQ